jgi:pimeloyl-ACP methyl ester carboxylesterase
MIKSLGFILILAAILSPALAADPSQSFVEAPGPTGPLKGTMLSPATPGGPVVLIIPGSGPVDRDGNSGAGLKASTYRLLAEGLATQGITTVRIDKRGMYASLAATPDGNAVTIAEYAADVHAWAAVIRQKTGADCIWLLGHSEGGLVALAAAKDAPDFCGLLLIAAPGRPLGEILREQLKANPANAPVLDRAFQAIDDLEAGKGVDTSGMHPALQMFFHPRVQGFLINVFSYDPANLIKGVTKPMLIVQGERDIQVSKADALRLKDANPNAKLALLPDVNHVLKSVTSADRAANSVTYSDPSLPLAPGVVETIAQFVNSEATHQ